MKMRYSEAQIVGTLKRQEVGTTVSDLCREFGISAGTFYSWRGKYGGREINEVKRLRELESANGKLKRLLTDKLLEV